jgi:hypothetical protein
MDIEKSGQHPFGAHPYQVSGFVMCFGISYGWGLLVGIFMAISNFQPELYCVGFKKNSQ